MSADGGGKKYDMEKTKENTEEEKGNECQNEASSNEKLKKKEGNGK